MRGQSAMEYLMTYGWALLVIVIVIAILLIINPFSVPQGCRFDQVGFACTAPVIDSTGKISMTLTNNMQSAVTVAHLECVSVKSSTPGTRAGVSPAVIIKPGETKAIIVAAACADHPEVGKDYAAKVGVFYNFEEDAGAGFTTERLSTANVATKISSP